ncbi:MAG: hypothetical protein A2Y48_01370 [Nitrospirae bacterium RIFCSPLOW2_12_42_9]|nr:MAG: hypothetical protein A2Y48_01370 [Nitrospirae bacterium RIFCSPLOW2_12_42_9]
MKKVIVSVVALLFVLSVTGLSFAAEEKKAEPAKKEKTNVHQITGDVTAVDATAKTVTIKGKGKDKDKDVTLGASGIKDLTVKVGDKVTARYTEKEGKMVAKSIKAAKAKPKKEEAKPAEPAKK